VVANRLERTGHHGAAAGGVARRHRLSLKMADRTNPAIRNIYYTAGAEVNKLPTCARTPLLQPRGVRRARGEPRHGSSPVRPRLLAVPAAFWMGRQWGGSGEQPACTRTPQLQFSLSADPWRAVPWEQHI
jgi:hypothetical protein